MSRSGRRWFLGGAVVMAVGAMTMFTPLSVWVHWALIKMPQSRDASLVGTWKGDKIIGSGGYKQARTLLTVLHADGNGPWTRTLNGLTGKAKFQWGTQNGVLYTRQMQTDCWVGERYPYRLTTDARTVRFANLGMFRPFSAEMRRFADAN